MFDIKEIMKSDYNQAENKVEAKPGYRFKIFTIFLKVIYIMIVDYFRKIFSTSERKRESIANQLALITGGGNGLGRAISFRLAQEKCDLAIVDVDYKNALKTAEEIMNEYDVTCKAFQCDISDISAVTKLKNDIESHMRKVDILVNNAGLLYLSNFFTSDVNDIQKVIQVNMTSHIVMTRTFLPTMIENKGGRIMTICSMACVITTPTLNVYTATKWGLNGFMKCLLDELAVKDYNKFISLTTVYPDIINTRKEALDKLDDIKYFLPRLSPQRVADEAVRGMLKKKSSVYVSDLTFMYFAMRFLSRRAKKYIMTNVVDLNTFYEK